MLNNRIALIALILFLSTPVSPGGFCQDKKPETFVFSSLDDAIILAYKNNLDIQIQKQDVEVAKADILGAKSAFLPQVNVNTGYTHTGTVLNLSSGVVQSKKKDIGILTGYKNDNTFGVSVGQTIYNGGANYANLQQARIGLSEEQQTLRARELDVEFETKRLYYGLLLAHETERITRDLVRQAEAHYEEVKRMYEQGTASKFDCLQSKVEVSLLMPELIKAENAVELIMAELKQLLNLKMKDTLKVEDRLDYLSIEIKEDDFLKEAYLYKPEMILKTLGIDLTKWGIEFAKAGWRPQIAASAAYTYRSNDVADMFNNRHSNWNIGFSINIPIFDGFSTKAKVDAAKAKYAQAKLDKENITEQIAVQVKQACLDLKEAETIIRSQRDNVEEAKEALKISEISYNNGVGINLDVLDSQVSLSQVEKNLAEGIYDYLIAKASLDRAMGRVYTEGSATPFNKQNDGRASQE